MKKFVFVFCGVESTGKSTAVEIIYKHLLGLGKKVEVVCEAGREVCAQSGGVFEMDHLAYEQILFLHQANFLKAYQSDCDIILLDTDATYTRYYLEKDETLFKKDLSVSKDLVQLSKNISKLNYDKFTKILYLNAECDFVQDGTRTYEESRFEDEKTLLNLYRKHYKDKVDIDIVCGKKWEDRIMKIQKIIENCLKNDKKSKK